VVSYINNRVLLVENDSQLSEVMKHTLDQKGCCVHTAVDIACARWSLGENIPDIIIIDIDLPGGNGIDLCRDVRSVSDIPVILISDQTKTDELLEKVFDAGADEYMVKPVNLNELALRIKSLIRRIKWVKTTKL